MSETTLFVSPSQSITAKLGKFHHPAVLLSCEKSFARLGVVNDMTIAEAFRQSWTCQPYKKKRVPSHAICHVRGIIRKVYKDLHWYPANVDEMYRLGHATGLILELANRDAAAPDSKLLREMLERFKHIKMTHNDDPDLWNFTGNEAPEFNKLIRVDLSAELTQRGMANPVRYINCD